MKNTKRLICLLLLAAMLLSLAACGKDGQNGDGGKAADTPTPEYVYASKFEQMENKSGRYLSASLFTESGFYCVQDEKVGELEHEGVTAQWEGQFDINEPRLYFIDYEGKKTKLENYEPARAEEGSGHEFHSGINNVIEGEDGGLLLIESTWEVWNDAPEDVQEYSEDWYNYQHYEEGCYISVLDSTGKVLSRTELDPGLGDDQYFYVNSAVMGDDGMLLAAWDQSIIAFDPATGKKAYSIELDNYADKILRLRDGRVAVMYYGNGYQLAILDTAAKALGESMPFDGDGYSAISGSGDYDLYYTSGINFYGYKLEAQQGEKLFNWISCDVNSDALSGYSINAEGEVIGIINTWDKNYENCTTELVTIEKQPYDPANQKTVLTLATQYLDWDVRDTVINFNRKNDKCRIEVIDYSEYNTEDDYEAGVKKLKTEIMAGKLPDILCLNGLSGKQLAAKGLIQDLYPLMDADAELKREDFFPNVLAAVEEDGKLFATVSNFYINTVIGASSIVGGEPGWNYAQLEEALATMPEGCRIFGATTTREYVLQSCLNLDMDNYVNWVTGECNFDSQDFVDLLNFANKFPAEDSFDWEKYEWSPEDDDYAHIAQGKQMLMQAGIFDFQSITEYQYAFGGEVDGFTFIGYPTNNGVGNMLGANPGYAITRDCADKEAAWQFIRTFFTEEYQDTSYQFPSNRKAFEAKLKEAMTPNYMKDEEGNFMLDENGERIEISHGGMGLLNGEMIEFYALTQEQADKLVALIENTDKVVSTDAAIFDIVNEQTAAFFAGQKSAEEVAKLVQSKANIYVNEQR